MDREEAIATLEDIKQFGISKWIFEKEDIEAFDMAIEALSEETPTIQEKHQLSEETPTNTPTDLIGRAEAIAQAKYLVNRWIGVTGKAYEEKVPLIEEVFNAIPSAKVPIKCIAEIKIDADEVAQKIKEKYDLADRPNIAYICDGMACDGECDECHHTTDIEHAKNFKRVGGKYIEIDDRPSGEWIIEEEYGDLWVCDQCGFANEHNDNYCPNCGAKMGGNK